MDMEKLVKRAKSEAEDEAETFTMRCREEATPRDAWAAWMNSRISQTRDLSSDERSQLKAAYEQAFTDAVKASL